MTQALVLTDDAELRIQLTSALAENGLEVLSPSDIDDALRLSRAAPAPFTFLDLDMTSSEPDAFMDGYLAPAGGRTLVAVASEKSIPRLTSAVESGASAYLKKPVVRGEVRVVLSQLRRLPRAAPPAVAMRGASPQVQAIRKLVSQVAQADDHVTVSGEPGVGKRVVGRLIHDHSSRQAETFVEISCAGVKEAVLAALLFGASSDTSGYLGQCEQGTLLIDDIDQLHEETQIRLHDYLLSVESASRNHPRIIAVSSQSLFDQVREGAFHAGLFDILDRFKIAISPLRERKSDIPILADHFSRSFAHLSARPARGIEPEALAELMRYDWPGNVRELEDILEYAVRCSAGSVLSLADLPALPETPNAMGPGPQIPGSTIHDIEKDAILRTLKATGGSTSKAATVLGMSVRKIQYKLKEYRIEASSIAAVESMPAVRRTRSAAAGKDPRIARPRRR